MPLLSQMINRETAIETVQTNYFEEKQLIPVNDNDGMANKIYVYSRADAKTNSRRSTMEVGNPVPNALQFMLTSQQKEVSNLMWSVIRSLEFCEMDRSQICKIFWKMGNEKWRSEFNGIINCPIPQLRMLCCEKFRSNPILHFQFTQNFLSQLLQNVDVHQLGEILRDLNATMENVARTDVFELIHAYDTGMDDENLIGMMERWVYLLLKINKCETQLHRFVICHLRDYRISNSANPKPWNVLINCV